MSETIRVPLEGNAVVNQSSVAPQAEPSVQERPETGFRNGQYQPPAERVTLHKTRLGVALQARQAEAKAPTPAPPQPSQSDAGRLGTLEAAVTALAATQVANMQQRRYDAPNRELEALMRHNQYSDVPAPYVGDQYGGGYNQEYQPQDDFDGAPDPDNYDLWDDYGRAQYKRDLDAHVKEVATRGIEAHTATQRGEAFKEDIARQCEAVRAKFGRDANYDEAANAAKLIHFNAGGKLTIEEAYLQASDEMEAKRGPRSRVSYMPKEIRGLGAMMEYRSKTGRARGR